MKGLIVILTLTCALLYNLFILFRAESPSHISMKELVISNLTWVAVGEFGIDLLYSGGLHEGQV